MTPPHISHKHHKPLVLITFTVLLLLRSRLLDIPHEILTKVLERRRSGRKLTKEELDRALQQLYVKEKDGTKTLLVPYQNGVYKVSYVRRTMLSPLIEI